MSFYELFDNFLTNTKYPISKGLIEFSKMNEALPDGKAFALVMEMVCNVWEALERNRK